MLNRFRTFVAENKLTEPSSGILLAVSGGIDSMVMTHLFIQSGNRLGIAHCNFMLRGHDSDMDEQMVAEFAAKNKIPFYSIKFQTSEYAVNNGLSIQMAARELRYAWFEKIRAENGYDSIAVAHNLDDNIETLLINLVRGTGIAGLAGMRVLSDKIIRPLLFATREEITEYCTSNGIIYREDRSNADTKYVRNKIRHLVIPVLKEINPSVETTLNETARRLSGINDIVTEYISQLREMVSEPDNEHVIFKINRLNPHLENRAILFELFRPYGISEASVYDLMDIIKGKTGSMVLTGSHRILRNREDLVVTAEKQTTEGPWVINSVGELKMVPEIEYVRSVKINSKFRLPADHSIMCIDVEKLSYPLTVRRWNAGDYFFPLGMDRKKKLSDFFTDQKYSAFDKEKTLILESDGKIVSVLGERIDNRFRITDSTKNALLIKIRKRKS
jgi:tRNA(Ile)-lysidine synthase